MLIFQTLKAGWQQLNDIRSGRSSALSSALLLCAVIVASGCSASTESSVASPASAPPNLTPPATVATGSASSTATTGEGRSTVVFAGGCFWCMEKPFDELAGVLDTVSGYAGGSVANPSYRQVTAGSTGHFEVVQVTYDPAVVSFAELLEVFWVNVDPLDDGGQFCDRGASYKTAVFVQNDAERSLAEKSKATHAAHFNRPIATVIQELAVDEFYPAEDYHQNYYLENPLRYQFYRRSCGRDARLNELWGDRAPHADS